MPVHGSDVPQAETRRFSLRERGKGAAITAARRRSSLFWESELASGNAPAKAPIQGTTAFDLERRVPHPRRHTSDGSIPQRPVVVDDKGARNDERQRD